MEALSSSLSGWVYLRKPSLGQIRALRLTTEAARWLHMCCACRAGSSEGREGVRSLAELQAEAKLQLKETLPPVKGRSFRPMVPVEAGRQPNAPGGLFSHMTRRKVCIDAAISGPHRFETCSAA